MNNIFSMDNLFFRSVGKMVDLIWINLLTLVCALPIFTAGASITAMYSVLLKMAVNEEGKLTASFFSAFKENFKNATKVWLVVLVIGLVYGADLNLVHMGLLNDLGLFGKIITGSVFLVVLIIVAIVLYLFPLLARYDRNVKQSLKNASLLAVAYLPRTVCMIVIWCFPYAGMLVSNYFLFLWPLYGLAFPAYFCCMLLVRIFEKVEENGAQA